MTASETDGAPSFSPSSQSAQSRFIAKSDGSYLGEHVRDSVTLGDAARAASTSPFTLARAFPAATETTMHRYLVSLRLAAALEAIAHGAGDLARVAVDAGFAHHSHLSKTFAREYGTTPRSLRTRLTPP